MLAKADGDLLQALHLNLVKLEEAADKPSEQPTPVRAIEAAPTGAEPAPAPERECRDDDNDGDEASDEALRLKS